MKHDLTNVPNTPGCYMWISKDGEVLYVGKAKNLKSRMNSYNNPSRATVSLLMQEVFSYEYITTKTELDSLILEQTLINKYEPKFNIKIKYSFTYPYILVDTRDGVKVRLANKVRKQKGISYYGPFPLGYGALKIVKMINNLYPIDKCLKPGSGEPCLNYQMGRCLGFCVKDVSQEDVNNLTNKITQFFKGDTKNTIDNVKEKIFKLSKELNFEEAQEWKEYLELIAKYEEKQTIHFNDQRNVDIIGYYTHDDYLSISLSLIRFGNLVGVENYIVKSFSSEIIQDVESFISLYYKGKMKPDYIYSREELQSELKVKVPAKSTALKLLEETEVNAKDKIEKELKTLKLKEERFEYSMRELKEIANISKLSRVEMIDISSTQGEEQVGVVVSFKDGIKYKNGYRKYIVKDINGMNDYASMWEVSYRHFRSKFKDETPMPNIFIVDGKHQVNAVKESLKELRLDIKVIGLIKDEKHNTSSIFVDGKVIELSDRSPLYLLLGNMQEEVHRFAISFHRQRRTKNLIKSELNEIRGISKDDINKLFETFGSMRSIKIASIDELAKVIGTRKAKLIYTEFD